MLLTVVSSAKPVEFYWIGLSSRTAQNATYASPSFFFVTG